jgi:hypothetical protein
MPTANQAECFLFETKRLPFRLELFPEPSFIIEKSRALAILRRGRSKGNPSLVCKDLLTSTAQKASSSDLREHRIHMCL